jgi:hypothetical protein
VFGALADQLDHRIGLLAVLRQHVNRLASLDCLLGRFAPEVGGRSRRPVRSTAGLPTMTIDQVPLH